MKMHIRFNKTMQLWQLIELEFYHILWSARTFEECQERLKELIKEYKI